MNKKINILGLGNTILGDEGFGVEAVRYLESRFQCPPEINIIDGGTQGLYLLDYIESADCLMIFDAVIPTSYDFKVYVYRNDDLPAFIHRKLSAHQMGLSELLSVAKLHDKVPDEVVLIGVPPKNLEMNIGLTDEVQNLIPDAVDRGVEIIKEWLDE